MSPDPRSPLRTGSRTSVSDIIGQAWRATVGRRVRSLLTASGIAVGITAAISTLGITTSMEAAVSDRFDATRATRVTVRFPPGTAVPAVAASARVRDKIHGVTDAGLLCRVKQPVPASRLPSSVTSSDARQVNVVAAEPTALAVLGVRVDTGRTIDAGSLDRADHVLLLDTVAVRDLGITDITANPTVYLSDVPFTLLGVYTAPVGDEQLTGTAILPYSECPSAGDADTVMVIRTDLGAADQVGEEAPLAILPEAVSTLQVLVPPDLRTFRTGVESDTRALYLGLAAVSLIVGAIGISNTVLISVMERRGEIGLRRAIGASRLAVAGQFLTESAFLGVTGGVLGTLLGINTIAATCLWRDWIITLDPRVLAAGPVLGLLIGMLAGLYPSYATTRVPPADALR